METPVTTGERLDMAHLRRLELTVRTAQIAPVATRFRPCAVPRSTSTHAASLEWRVTRAGRIVVGTVRPRRARRAGAHRKNSADQPPAVTGSRRRGHGVGLPRPARRERQQSGRLRLQRDLLARRPPLQRGNSRRRTSCTRDRRSGGVTDPDHPELVSTATADLAGEHAVVDGCSCSRQCCSLVLVRSSGSSRSWRRRLSRLRCRRRRSP